MIKYPDGRKFKSTKKKRTSANRGMSLEHDLNVSNQYYLDLNIANIHKKPTPVQIVHVDYPQRSAAKIDEAYFQVPSTTDYNGVYRGKALDFEAKETKSETSFPLSSIHDHQIEHLKNVEQHGAIAFVIIRFSAFDETYYVNAKDIIDLYYGKRRSIPYQWFKDHAYLIPVSLTPPVDYLTVVDRIYFKGVKYGQ